MHCEAPPAPFQTISCLVLRSAVRAHCGQRRVLSPLLRTAFALLVIVRLALLVHKSPDGLEHEPRVDAREAEISQM